MVAGYEGREREEEEGGKGRGRLQERREKGEREREERKKVGRRFFKWWKAPESPELPQNSRNQDFFMYVFTSWQRPGKQDAEGQQRYFARRPLSSASTLLPLCFLSLFFSFVREISFVLIFFFLIYSVVTLCVCTLVRFFLPFIVCFLVLVSERVV